MTSLGIMQTNVHIWNELWAIYDLDSGLVEHVDWDKEYVIVTHVIIDIVDACIACGIESNFDGS